MAVMGWRAPLLLLAGLLATSDVTESYRGGGGGGQADAGYYVDIPIDTPTGAAVAAVLMTLIVTGVVNYFYHRLKQRNGKLHPRRLYILCWSELSRRRLLPAVSPAAGHLTTPTVAGLPGLCENFRPTTPTSSPILRLLSSHWATSVVRTRVVGVANVGDSLRRLSSLQHRIYNLLGLYGLAGKAGSLLTLELRAFARPSGYCG